MAPILFFSLRPRYPSCNYKNLGCIFRIPPTKSDPNVASDYWKLLFLHLALLNAHHLHHCSLHRYNKRYETTQNMKGLCIISLYHYNNRFQTGIVRIPCYNYVMYNDLWNLNLSHLNQLRWKSFSLESDNTEVEKNINPKLNTRPKNSFLIYVGHKHNVSPLGFEYGSNTLKMDFDWITLVENPPF